MNLREYEQMVEALAKPGAEIIAGLSPVKAHLLHMAVGVCGEAGELLDAIKKHTIYGKPLDDDNIIEELGDLEFYITGLLLALSISREDVRRVNFDKLKQRYASGKYSDAQAQRRADKMDSISDPFNFMGRAEG